MSKRILLADDSAAVKKSIEKTLDAADFQLLTAENGSKAMEQVADLRPHLVLAHALLPEIDGYEVCRRVKENPDTSHIPVLLLTGTFEPFDINRAKEVGYDGFVTKPLDGQELRLMMEQVIDRAVYPAESPEPSPTPEAVVEEDPQPLEVTEFSTATIDPVEPVASEAILDRIFPEDSPQDEVIQTVTDVEGAGEELFTVIEQTEEEAAPPADPDVWGSSTTAPEAVPEAEPATDAALPNEDSDLSWFLRKFEEKETGTGEGDEAKTVIAETVAEEPEVLNVDSEPVAAASPEDDPFGAVTEEGGELLTVDDDPAPGLSSPAAEETPEPPEVPATAVALDDAQLEQISRRVVELLSESVVRDVAWEAVPEIAERLIRERIKEIEAEADTSK